MKLPNINIAFSTQAASAIERSEKGIVCFDSARYSSKWRPYLNKTYTNT